MLFVSTHCPSRAHAGGLRLLDIASRLRVLQPGLAIDVFTFRNPEEDWSYADVETRFDRVFYSDTTRLTHERFAAERPPRLDYDVVSFEYQQRADNVRSYLPHAGKTLFTPMELKARAYALAPQTATAGQRRREIARERAVSGLVDEVVCVAEADAQFARRAIPFARVACLETGVSEIEFANAEPAPVREPFTALFIGYFGAATNIAALTWYLDHVHPRVVARFPLYRLDVVGRGDLSAFRPRAGPSLNLVGEVAQTWPYIARAAVGLAPAVSGAGFRGKINQYAYLATPCVASQLAVEGFVYRDREDIRVAGTPEAFAAAIGELLADPARREAMGARARQTCLAHYAWASKDDEIRRLFNLAAP